jgi:hypothetical protein
MADEMQGTDGTLEIIVSLIRVFPCDPGFKHLRDGCEGGQCLAPIPFSWETTSIRIRYRERESEFRTREHLRYLTNRVPVWGR